MNLEVTEQTLMGLFQSRERVRPRKHAVMHLQRKWLEELPAVSKRAIEGSRLMSLSYRNFRVGAAFLCYSGSTGEYEIINAGNLKLWSGCPKCCAEMTGLRIIPKRFDLIIGIAVYGEEVQPDPSGHEGRTLHPCPPCRQELEADPRIKPWTRIYMFRPWKQDDLPTERRYGFVREHMSFRELMKIHADGNGMCN